MTPRRKAKSTPHGKAKKNRVPKVKKPIDPNHKGPKLDAYFSKVSTNQEAVNDDTLAHGTEENDQAASAQLLMELHTQTIDRAVYQHQAGKQRWWE